MDANEREVAFFGDSDEKVVMLLALAEVLGLPYRVLMTETSVSVEWL